MVDMKVASRERTMLIILGVVAVLGVGFLVLSGGDDKPPPAVIDVPTTRPIPTAPRNASPTPGQTVQPDSLDPGDARDPFRSPIAGQVPPGGNGGNGGNGGTPPPDSSTPTPGETGGTQQGTRVVLLDIFERDGTRFASVEVGGEVHNVKEGDTFAESYGVVNITQSCATFVNGDERFTLCIGQEVFK